MMRTKLKQHEIDTLQALANYYPCLRNELPELSGWDRQSVERSMVYLRRHGLVERVSGDLRASVKGKIVLALLVGQRTKRNYNRRRQQQAA